MDEFYLDIIIAPEKFSMDMTLEANTYDLNVSFSNTIQVIPPDLAYGGSSFIQ